MLGMTDPVWVGWHAQCVLVHNYIENNICQNLHYRSNVVAYTKNNKMLFTVHIKKLYAHVDC
jgi:type II secretory pathway component PulJ